MTHVPICSHFLAQARAEAVGRTLRHAEQCVLLAVVTSTDIAASLIDEAIRTRATIEDVPLAA